MAPDDATIAGENKLAPLGDSLRLGSWGISSLLRRRNDPTPLRRAYGTAEVYKGLEDSSSAQLNSTTTQAPIQDQLP
jgi:hypothetical protein